MEKSKGKHDMCETTYMYEVNMKLGPYYATAPDPTIAYNKVMEHVKSECEGGFVKADFNSLRVVGIQRDFLVGEDGEQKGVYEIRPDGW